MSCRHAQPLSWDLSLYFGWILWTSSFLFQLLSLRWSEDLRVQEVRHMLQSAHPVRIAIVQRPEVSDHDFIEEQERHLYSICIRTMALPVGR